MLAVDKGQARAIFRFVLGLLKAVPMLEPLIVRRDSETIELSNRVHIEIGTASFRSTRGYTYAAVLCDELAFWRSDETSLNPDVEILRALRPGMVSIPGSVLVHGLEPLCAKGRALRRLPPALRQGRRPRAGVESLDAGDEPRRRSSGLSTRPTRTIRKAPRRNMAVSSGPIWPISSPARRSTR